MEYFSVTYVMQWRNSRGKGAEGQTAPPPPTLLKGTGKFLLTYREKRGKEKTENGEERKENRKTGRWITENGRRFAFHFSKPLKFVLCLPKWEFSTGKSISHRENSQEKWLCPLWKIFLLRLWRHVCWHIMHWPEIGNNFSLTNGLFVLIDSSQQAKFADLCVLFFKEFPSDKWALSPASSITLYLA